MSVATWRWPQVVLLWLAALGAVVGLAVVDILRQPRPFFWLVPYPGTLRGAGMLLQALWHVVPLATAGLVVAPLAALALTTYWLVVRVRA